MKKRIGAEGFRIIEAWMCMEARAQVSREGESAVVKVMDSWVGIEDEIVQNRFRFFFTTNKSGTARARRVDGRFS